MCSCLYQNIPSAIFPNLRTYTIYGKQKSQSLTRSLNVTSNALSELHAEIRAQSNTVKFLFYKCLLFSKVKVQCIFKTCGQTCLLMKKVNGYLCVNLIIRCSLKRFVLECICFFSHAIKVSYGKNYFNCR